MLIRALFAVAILVLSTGGDLYSQAKVSKPIHVGAGAGISLSGSGHGAFYDMYVSLSRGKSNVTIGPAIQKRTGMVGSGKITYSYILGARDDEGTMVETADYKSSDILQLGVFSYLQYSDNLPLGYQRAKNETQADVDKMYDWNSVRISTVEGGVGLEVFVRISRKLRWRTFAGISAYYHSGYNDKMYQERSATVLMAGTSLNFLSFKKTSAPAK